MGLLDWFSSPITAAEVRAEIWRLGVRHHGEALKGAKAELAADSGGEASALLRACIRKLS